MKFFSITTFPIFLLAVFFSCSVSKPTYYFKDIKRDTIISTAGALNSGELKIKNGDILGISFSSLSREEDDIFNKPGIQSATGVSTATSLGFPVDKDGNIYLHKLGRVKAEGMTRTELKIYLEKQLQPYLKDPIIAVNFTNHYITVIGQVGNPQLLNMPNERISILDVLAQTGNVNPIAQMNNLMVVREKDQSKEFKHINLEDQSIFASPWYYLQPNDIVVVNPDEKRMVEEQRRAKYQQTASIIFQALTTVIIVYQAFFRN